MVAVWLQVCLTLFWLSQILEYSGPQLDLTPFVTLFPDQQVRATRGDSQFVSLPHKSPHVRLDCTAMPTRELFCHCRHQGARVTDWPERTMCKHLISC